MYQKIVIVGNLGRTQWFVRRRRERRSWLRCLRRSYWRHPIQHHQQNEDQPAENWPTLGNHSILHAPLLTGAQEVRH